MKQVLKFSATWCSPCKALSKNIEQVDFGDVELVEVDIDQDMEKARNYQVRGVPTLVMLEDGKEIKRHSGLLTTTQLEEFIK